MALTFRRGIVLAMAIPFAVAACAGDRATLPNTGVNEASLQTHARSAASRPSDNHSILKRLKRDVVIGSTIDPSNGDTAPRAISVVSINYILEKGQLLVCNYDDAAGEAGAGTTIEVLDPVPGSTPVRLAQSESIEGCDGTAIVGDNDVYGAGLTGHSVVQFDPKGGTVRTYSRPPIASPISDGYASPQGVYSPDYVFVGSTDSGAITSISVGSYGTGAAVEVASGFPVSKGSGANELGPSGLQYDSLTDTLYIVDGSDDSVVAFWHASDLVERDEIIVEPGGKTFKCKHPKTTCGRLVYSGSPLQGPMAAALLPNGNLIVANTQGTPNTLVELTPTGKILDTKVVDSSNAQGVFGLAAVGTDDSNTTLFFTDTNSNNVQELEH